MSESRLIAQKVGKVCSLSDDYCIELEGPFAKRIDTNKSHSRHDHQGCRTPLLRVSSAVKGVLPGDHFLGRAGLFGEVPTTILTCESPLVT